MRAYVCDHCGKTEKMVDPLSNPGWLRVTTDRQDVVSTEGDACSRACMNLVLSRVYPVERRPGEWVVKLRDKPKPQVRITLEALQWLEWKLRQQMPGAWPAVAGLAVSVAILGVVAWVVSP